MKTLFLVRHAKSSWEDENLADFDRPLNDRGLKDAPLMAKHFIEEEGNTIDVIIASPAYRAQLTALEFQNELGCEIIYDQAIYDKHHESMKKIIKAFDDKYETVMVIGHNPSINKFAKKYAGVGENVPTTGIVGMKFDVESWSDISSERAIFKCFLYPKLFRF